MKRFKRHEDYGFREQDLRLSKLSNLGDPLEMLCQGIDFELFSSLLEARLSQLSKGPDDRPAHDCVLIFRILILQRYYNLSDDQIEYQSNDRLSFMRFPDLSIADAIPGSKTVWFFRKTLTDLDLVGELFDLFLQELHGLGLIVNEGKIIDAGFVEVPRQRNSRDENKEIKEGIIPDSFKENPHSCLKKIWMHVG